MLFMASFFGNFLEFNDQEPSGCPASSGTTADEMMLSLWGILTFLFFVQTLRINRALQTLFISLSILFFLLAAGVKNALCNKVQLPAPGALPSACTMHCSGAH